MGSKVGSVHRPKVDGEDHTRVDEHAGVEAENIGAAVDEDGLLLRA